MNKLGLIECRNKDFVDWVTFTQACEEEGKELCSRHYKVPNSEWPCGARHIGTSSLSPQSIDEPFALIWSDSWGGLTSPLRKEITQRPDLAPCGVHLNLRQRSSWNRKAYQRAFLRPTRRVKALAVWPHWDLIWLLGFAGGSSAARAEEIQWIRSETVP